MTKKELKRIEEFVYLQYRKNVDTYHNLKHTERVRKNAQKIVKSLNLKTKIDINLLAAICLLHDLTYSKYKTSIFSYIFEPIIIKRLLHKAFLKKLKFVSQREKNVIINATTNHCFSFPFKKLNKKNSLYSQILQDADTLDQFNPKRLKDFKKQAKTDPLFKLIDKSGIINKGIKNLPNYLNFPEVSNFITKSKKC